MRPPPCRFREFSANCLPRDVPSRTEARQKPNFHNLGRAGEGPAPLLQRDTIVNKKELWSGFLGRAGAEL